MKKRLFLSILSVLLVLFLHASYTIAESRRLAERWETMREVNYLALYIARNEYFVGGSYALAVAFSIYALLRFVESRANGLVGVLGGMTLTGILYIGGCFLLGCCGSPMLAVYLTLFGSSFLGFTKPLIFTLTLTSVVVGYFWMERNSRSTDACVREDDRCKPE